MADKKISALTGASTPLAGTEVLPIVQSGATVKVSVANLTAGRAVSADSVTQNINYTSARAASAPTYGGNYYIYSGTGLNSAIGGIEWQYATAGAGYGFKLNASGAADAIEIGHRANSATWTVDWQFKNDGNLVAATAAKGVNFTANTPAAGMTSQLLNWYEEGTFTPAIEGETTNPTVGYSTQYGAYTRIGRMVNFSIRLTLSSLSGGSGNVKIVGLPFTAGLSNNPYACAMEVSGVTFGAGLTAISYRPLSGQTWGRLNQFGSGAAAAATTIAQLSSTADIIISGAYMV